MKLDQLEILRKYFGYHAFRPGQEQVINAILENRDVLGIMPTGAGKSLCYQIPALMLPGVCLVISPLISLMKDQVMALKASGVPAAYLNTSLTEKQMSLAMERAANGAYKIIYVAPERLRTQAFRNLVHCLKISLVAVDEAHCVSQWGHEFRPEYRQIAGFVNELPERPHYCAFTATATDEVRRDMIDLLGLRHPFVTVTGFDRPNLFFEIRHSKDRNEELLGLCMQRRKETGIVYCMSRKNVEQVCELLQQAGLSATRYHAGLSDAERKKNQEDFQYDRARIMVATNAFGMGIDKSNVRYVIHYNLPLSMEAYYQEAGRAGRDGLDAVCILLFSPQDIGLGEYLLENADSKIELSEQEKQKLLEMNMRRFRNVQRYAQTRDCLRHFILAYFGEKAEKTCQGCSNCKRAKAALRKRKPVQRQEAWSWSLAPSPAPATEGRRPVQAAKEKKQLPQIHAEEGTLLGYLIQVRAILASNAGLPPYIVCSDTALKNLAEECPLSVSELAEIEGMGYARARAYGDAFVHGITSWIQQAKSTGNAPAWKSADAGQIQKMRGEGMTPRKIADQLGISVLQAAFVLAGPGESTGGTSRSRPDPKRQDTPRQRPWYPKEINWLRMLHRQKGTVHSIARQMGRTDREIVDELGILGLKPYEDLPETASPEAKNDSKEIQKREP